MGYLCELVSDAILCVKLLEMFVILMSNTLCRLVDDHVDIFLN